MAFTGWSDTGTVTTDLTAQHLVDAYNAERFLTVDPEDYYVFTDSRPHVRIEEGRRAHASIGPRTRPTSPASRMPPTTSSSSWAPNPTSAGAPSPNASPMPSGSSSPSLICTLVARPAATPHTRPVPVTGSSADPRLAARFGLGRSLYQGPTGILGVLHDSLRRRGADLISLAAGVPHYLNVEENPPATLALLNALEPVLGVAPPIGDLDDEVDAPSPAASRKPPAATTRSPTTSAPSKSTTAKVAEEPSSDEAGGRTSLRRRHPPRRRGLPPRRRPLATAHR